MEAATGRYAGEGRALPSRDGQVLVRAELLHPPPRKIDSVALKKDTLMKTQSHACQERRARCILGPKFTLWQADADRFLARGQAAGGDMSSPGLMLFCVCRL